VIGAISIDVDSLRFYRRIHGEARADAEHSADAAEHDDPLYSVAMPRFFELLLAVGVPATLFLIGEDAPRHSGAFDGLGPSGSEVASHSFSHDYRLTTRPREQIDLDLSRAVKALAPLSPARPIVGFRAPGYNVTGPLLEAAVAAGARYDSSLLPSPWYWAARASVLGAYDLVGRRSDSMRGDWRQFAGPLAPYRTRPDAPWRDTGPSGSLLELPMACDPLTRVPFFGTSWVVLPRPAQELALRSAFRGLRFLNFELHAIDLVDRSDAPALGELAPLQRDLQVPATKKLASFRRLFSALRSHSDVLTLADAAERLS
jgi:hypothetical protein